MGRYRHHVRATRGVTSRRPGLGQCQQVGHRSDSGRFPAVPVEQDPAKSGPLGPENVILRVVAHAEDATRRKAEAGAGGQVKVPVRFTESDLGGDDQRVGELPESG